MLPDVQHTSVLTRAIQTANIALDVADRAWIDVRRSWRLNERHYGALQGLDKAETLEKYGAEQFQLWRRSFDVPPPVLADDAEWSQVGDPRYANLADDELPRTECLKDVIARMLPYWESDIIPDLAAGKTVLVTAHGNSLRALVKHLDGISDDEIAELNIPTGIPLVYELGDDFMPLGPGALPRPRGRRGRRGRGGRPGQEVADPIDDEGRGMSTSPALRVRLGRLRLRPRTSRGPSRRSRGTAPSSRSTTAWSANRSWYRLASVASTVSTASPFHFSPSTLSNTERCSASTLSSSLRISSASCDVLGARAAR